PLWFLFFLPGLWLVVAFLSSVLPAGVFVPFFIFICSLHVLHFFFLSFIYAPLLVAACLFLYRCGFALTLVWLDHQLFRYAQIDLFQVAFQKTVVFMTEREFAQGQFYIFFRQFDQKPVLQFQIPSTVAHAHGGRQHTGNFR